ncbi:lipase/esterase [Rhizoctonia solani 123E]|uniref:Lipase/esterase n=1 Tax=Rhizoctonia solani 123E TaxID=1423351 RepID=A0A074RMF4_9AGAM|nr:lipase/esterase [Rhizoctonia solani 123E]
MTNTIQIPQNVLEQLDPEFRQFVQSSKIVPTPSPGLQWSPSFRQSLYSGDLGSTEPIAVGSTRNIQLGHFSIRVMTPPGEKPSQGWPVLLNLHGGGWVFGDAATDDTSLSKLCIATQCVTVSVEYRLAPEHPFPAGLNDSWDALVWLSKEAEHEIGIDPKRIAIMGTSAGGNLAAVVAQRASLASPRIPLVFQALLVPVLNASFSADDRSGWTTSMVEHEDNWVLPTSAVFWFRDLYVSNEGDRVKPEVSPCYQEDKLAYEGMPPTRILVAEMDPLRSEGEMYGAKLQTYGVPVTLRTLKGIPHTGVVADRVCGEVRKHFEELVDALRKAFV